MTILAPAKLNLHLAVKNKRSDGFHDIESVFVALNFGDIIHFDPIPGKNSLEIAMPGAKPGLPVEKNIIFHALSLFRSKTGFDQGIKITVEKKIPIGGGLGGGSSNAAATLLALNKLSSSPMPKDALLELAAALGSDVPFFVHETPAAWVTGRGERIEPLEMPFYHFVLVNPGFPSDTAAAYRLFDEKGKKGDSHPFPPAKKGDCHLLSFYNDFLPVFPDPEKSVYGKIISQLQELGAGFASLSGAGSTCFGVFGDKAQAEEAAAAMRGEWGFAECCESIEFSRIE